MAKKKINRLQQQKLQSAQHRKAFMQKLRFYCSILDSDNSAFYDDLSEPVRAYIYRTRGTSCTIRVAKGVKITKRFAKILYAHISEQTKSETLLVLPFSDETITLADYFQVLLPFENALTWAPSEREVDSNTVHGVAATHREEYNQKIVQIINNACYAFSDLSKGILYTFTYEQVTNPGRDARMRQIVTIGTLSLDLRHITINGERRPICQVGEVKREDNVSRVETSKVLLSRLKIEGAAPGATAPVYVQNHAIRRISERACCPFPGTVAMLITDAFSQGRRIIIDGKGQYLIECYYENVKIGYLVATYIDEMLLIRTFLLITHSGTPEGRKLEELTGLQRKDKSYLALDDMRSLANSDIIDDPSVRRLFVEAGCESVLHLCLLVREGEYGWLGDKGKPSRELAKLIIEYIQLGDEDDEYYVNEDED